jgi:hypothetical protein
VKLPRGGVNDAETCRSNMALAVFVCIKGAFVCVMNEQFNTDHVFCITKYLRKKWEYSAAVYQVFIEFNKACGLFRRVVLYNIHTEFDTTMALVKLIKMYLKERYSKARIGKDLCDIFLI